MAEVAAQVVLDFSTGVGVFLRDQQRSIVYQKRACDDSTGVEALQAFEWSGNIDCGDIGKAIAMGSKSATINLVLEVKRGEPEDILSAPPAAAVGQRLPAIDIPN
ncbi:hypothetical protein [Bradyrhizobium sp. ARR65]|uniref:hypothetical protein n=1 Tax=Bradyrhizobium sp. ARR65 TaxID=1040989 RepID=UPI0005529544|nr:hypothetical protein [Bradyrhizobium sp. ARR65]